jgi:cytochrome c oxidase subunit II
VVCHSIDGMMLYGPPLNDVFMKEITVLRDGKEINVLVNQEYLKRAITQPPYEKVLEYKSKDMPLTFLTNQEVNILVEYIVVLSEKDQNNK